ncbi:MAG: methylmalonyl-CoA epimerase [Flavobacteriales bacterium CG_4_9_14_3_um_filter_40_17]|nr:MAG: methylmalonyl-CoA epimerase [Flavobacteriales bacterium CG_4_9_14_3_um_filter_40_17]
MNKIEHIGIAVSDLGLSEAVFDKLLNRKAYKSEEVESEKVKTTFYRLGESKIELLSVTHPDSVIAKYIDKRGSGMHHIAIAVDDIHQEITRLKKEQFVFIDEQPKRGADNKLIVFLHPKSTGGVLVELCQGLNDN